MNMKVLGLAEEFKEWSFQTRRLIGWLITALTGRLDGPKWTIWDHERIPSVAHEYITIRQRLNIVNKSDERVERLRYLVRKNHARSDVQSLREHLAGFLGISPDKVSLLSLEEGDRFFANLYANLGELRQSSCLVVKRGLPFEDAVLLLEDFLRASCQPGRIGIGFEKNRDIGILETVEVPSLPMLKHLCEWDREGLWFGQEELFLAQLDLYWDDEWNPSKVVCELYLGLH